MYFLFTYQESRDEFAIPYDIEILKEVFGGKAEAGEAGEEAPLYNRRNKFFVARSIAEVIKDITDDEEKEKCRVEMERVKGEYAGLSEVYQRGKREGVESASIWK